MAPERWYFSAEEIKKYSPSRKDGISFKYESHLRQLYCSFIKDIGMELEMPQKTIASAMVLCHRFYMRQSHAKNSWQTMASSSLFLAAKSEDTPRFLRDIVCLAYQLQHQCDPLARQRIKRDAELYDKQKETVLLGERLLLFTLGFQLDVELPYGALVAAVKNLGVSESDVVKVSWNYVNDWLGTTLCLRYEPDYIAAGSLYLAAKRVKLDLPSSGDDAWWMQFKVSPNLLDGVIQHMLRLEERAQKRAAEFMSSPESCASVAHEGEDDGQMISTGQSDQEKDSGSNGAGVDMDIDGIREKMKMLEKAVEDKPSSLETLEIRDEALMERELESGQSEETKSDFERASNLEKPEENKPSALEIRDDGLDEALIERELDGGQSEETKSDLEGASKLEKPAESKQSALEIRDDDFDEALIERELESVQSEETKSDLEGASKLEKPAENKASALEIRDDDLDEALIETELDGGQSEETKSDFEDASKLEKPAENKSAPEIRDHDLDGALIERELDGGQSEEIKSDREPSEETKQGFKRASVDDNHINIDIDGIRERRKRRKLEKPAENKASALEIRDDDLDEAWIERELEGGLEK